MEAEVGHELPLVALLVPLDGVGVEVPVADAHLEVEPEDVGVVRRPAVVGVEPQIIVLAFKVEVH